MAKTQYFSVFLLKLRTTNFLCKKLFLCVSWNVIAMTQTNLSTYMLRKVRRRPKFNEVVTDNSSNQNRYRFISSSCDLLPLVWLYSRNSRMNYSVNCL